MLGPVVKLTRCDLCERITELAKNTDKEKVARKNCMH